MSVPFSACRCQPVTSVDRGPVLVLLHVVWVLASVGSNTLHVYGHLCMHSCAGECDPRHQRGTHSKCIVQCWLLEGADNGVL